MDFQKVFQCYWRTIHIVSCLHKSLSDNLKQKKRIIVASPRFEHRTMINIVSRTQSPYCIGFFKFLFFYFNTSSEVIVLEYNTYNTFNIIALNTWASKAIFYCQFIFIYIPSIILRYNSRLK